jgi:hypothetical protein
MKAPNKKCRYFAACGRYFAGRAKAEPELRAFGRGCHNPSAPQGKDKLHQALIFYVF